MLSLISLPSATSTFANISEWSSPLFTELLPLVYLAGGLTFAVFMVLFIIGQFRSFLHRD